jgi:nitrous oxidase accessory protein
VALGWWGAGIARRGPPPCGAARPGPAAAVKAAAPGDVIEVARGMYRVNLLIDKPLTLRGIDRPTLSGGQPGRHHPRHGPDVVIEGLIVRDSGDSLKDQNAGIYSTPARTARWCGCDLTYNLFGLWIEKANDVRIEAATSSPASATTHRPSAATASSSTTPPARASIGNNISFVRDALYVDVSHHATFGATSCTTAATARTT